MKFKYPIAKREDSPVEIYKSKEKTEVSITDHYRWLEDPNSDETKNWVLEENKVSRSFLDTDDLKDQFEKELLERVNYEKYGFFVRRDNLLFYSKNPGLLNQSIVYLKDLNTDKEMVFLDPNSYSQEGTWSLSRFTVTKHAKYVAVGYSKGGSDWVTFQIFKVPESIGEDVKIEILSDLIEWTKFSSIEWTKNEDGFFYTRYSKPETLESDEDKGKEADENKFQKLYYHQVGQDQSKDILVIESKENPNWMFGAEFTHDDKNLTIGISRDCNPENNFYFISNALEVIQGRDKEFKVFELISDFKANFSYLTNIGGKFIFYTNYLAPMNRLISIELPENFEEKFGKNGGKIPFEAWSDSIKDFVPQREYLLESASISKANKIYVVWLKDIQNQIEVFDISGERLHDIPLPCPGTVSSFSCNPDHNHIYMMFESFTLPKVIFYMNSLDDKLTTYVEPQIKNYNSQEFECKQEFFESKDGTKVPMFIVHRKGLEKTGSTPTYMLGYGGFNISYSPYFSLYNMYFVSKFNGIFVVANIRGGGEYGKKWHEQGTKERKQNCFDDFISAAEYLIKSRYTDSEHLVINGGSNGGLLMAAVSNQRPDLFKSVVCEVGVLDMLRFHKFTIGSHWSSDYGCADEPVDFDYLIKYSPLHNVPKDSKIYPNFLCLTGDRDDRVVPAHSYKFMAELQHQLGEKVDTPLFILIDVNTGHGAGKPLSKYTKKFSDILNFISKTLNIKF